MFKIQQFILIAALMAFPAMTASAAVMTQASGADYVAYEAESDVTINSSWSEVAVTGASEGSLLESTNAGGKGSGHYFSHDLQFTEAGTYHLYIRSSKVSGSTGNNAIFVASGFNVNPTDGGNFVTQNKSGVNSTPSWFEASIVVTVSASGGGSPSVGEQLTYVIKAADNPQHQIDRIVFSKQSGLTDVQLDALTNSVIPEPASLMLLLPGLALAVSGRRRG